MLNVSEMKRKEISSNIFIDTKNQEHYVYHSVIGEGDENQEIKEQILDNLFLIFSRHDNIKKIF